MEHEPAAGHVLLIDDDDLVRDSVALTLSRAGYAVTTAGSGTEALDRLHRRQATYDLILTDLQMPGPSGLELLPKLAATVPDVPVVLMTAYATVQTAVQAMREGAYDYLQKPFNPETLLRVTARAAGHVRLLRENRVLREAAGVGEEPRPMIGTGEAMMKLRHTVERVARSSATVLVRGESGTGKEVVARMVHALSDRRDRPLLCVNCAALSENLLESELFGHEKGAFTGADKQRQGRFELADGGTLLLDEVSEIAPRLQAKLLRVLQEQAFERVGSGVTRKVDVRVIATSNRDLDGAVRAGTFREDLFYRLNVVPITLPPLRERREDVPDLVRHFLHRVAKRDGQPFRHVETEAMRLLQRYPWPGNVRELQNIIERAAVLEREPGVVRAATVAPWLDFGCVTSPAARPSSAAVTASDPLDLAPLAEVEKRVILDTLAKFEGHRAKTASALGIGLRTLGIKLKKWKQEGDLPEPATAGV